MTKTSIDILLNYDLERKSPGGRVKLKEGVLQGVIQLHNRGLHTAHNQHLSQNIKAGENHLVSTAVAIVGCREDGDNISVVGPVVPLHHQLVCPATMA